MPLISTKSPTFGISWSGGDQVGPARIAAGRRPEHNHEVAMDVGTASRHGFKVGDRVKVLLTGPAERFTIVGLLKLGTQGDFGAVSFAAFDPNTAQRVFGAQGLYDLGADPAESTDLTASHPDLAGLGASKLADAAQRVKQGN